MSTTYSLLFRKKYTQSGAEETEVADFDSDRAALSAAASLAIEEYRRATDWRFVMLRDGNPARYIIGHNNASREFLIDEFDAWVALNR